MNPHRRTIAATPVAVVVLLAGLAACSATPRGRAGSPRTVTVDVRPTDSNAASTTTATSPTPPSRSSSTVRAAAVTTTPPPALAGGDRGRVVVDATPLPADVVTAIRAGGGELVTTDVWTARYGTGGLPTIDGPDVMLAEASLDVERAGTGWRRSDARQWLFAAAAGDRDLILDRLANTAGITTPATVDDAVVDGAQCTTRTYPSGPVTWTVQGCTYPRYPTMLAAAITRTGTGTPTAGATGGGVPVVEPSTIAVTGLLDGRVESLSVALGHPGAAGSTVTLHTTVTVSWPTRPDAAQRLAAGPLAGWQQSPSDSSVSFVGLAGQWIVTASGATFTSAGRLAR